MSDRSAHVLHVFSTFVPAGPEMRAVALIGAFGERFRHSIVAIDGRTSAAEHLPPGIRADVLEPPPKAGSLATTRRLRKLVRSLRPDLLLSYNFGAFDAVFAARSLGLRAIVHHEDGFNADESAVYLRRRVLARRIFLPGVHSVVVPSRNLERIARGIWRLPSDKVRYVPNGVRLERFLPRDGRPGLRREIGIPDAALVLGWVGHLRPEKNPARFLQACARVDPEIDKHALILGDGPERPALEELAARTASLFGRVHLVGHQKDPRDYYRAMDVFCLSSDTEQMPVALVEAMASSLPVVATDVGDVRAMLPEEQAAFVVGIESRETAWPMAEALTAVLGDPDLRERLGARNRAKVEAEYTFEGMARAYDAIYGAALGDSGA